MYLLMLQYLLWLFDFLSFLILSRVHKNSDSDSLLTSCYSNGATLVKYFLLLLFSSSTSCMWLDPGSMASEGQQDALDFISCSSWSNHLPNLLSSWNLVMPLAVLTVSKAFLQMLINFLNLFLVCAKVTTNSLHVWLLDLRRRSSITTSLHILALLAVGQFVKMSFRLYLSLIAIISTKSSSISVVHSDLGPLFLTQLFFLTLNSVSVVSWSALISNHLAALFSTA